MINNMFMPVVRNFVSPGRSEIKACGVAGSGLDMVEYDLLEIGDDVVFGSRSAVGHLSVLLILLTLSFEGLGV